MQGEEKQALSAKTESAEPERGAGQESTTVPELPADALIILPARNVVLFPGIVLPLTVGRRRSIAAAQEATRTESHIGIILQRDASVDSPAPEDLYDVGTVSEILRYVTGADGAHHLICQGRQRFRIVEYLEGYPFMAARVERIEEPEAVTPEIEARVHRLKQEAEEALELMPQAPSELGNTIAATTAPGTLADLVASFVDLKPSQKQEVLESFQITERLDTVLELLAHRLAVLRLSQEISQRTKEAVDERQREYLLREQMRTIQRELGEVDGKTVEMEELTRAINKAKMPQEADEQARRELARLERMPEAAAEYAIIRNYLDWLTALPWSTLSEESIDIAAARDILDEDHYGLEKIKKRILEYLAVRKLNPEGKGPILCFLGPPGVGKTSLGRSIARATGRKFIRAALGGVHDESEIRGHRRTYIGAMPGNIIQSIRKVETRNPVFMLDEMDKLGASFHGDPSSALLEVLDPEQNASFRDNYLGVPFDLSKVMFIGTANMLDTIPGPLRDRMEVIDLPGYTDEEKLQIAQRYLVRRQLDANGLKPEQCEISEKALLGIIHDYTRESGVRNLERQIGSVCRYAAVRIAEGTATAIRVSPDDLHDILGAKKFESEVAMRTSVPGVITGLAWTPFGGDILFIEASRVPGNGRLILTGQLGDVMKESAQAALSLIKARSADLGVPVEEGIFEKSDIHIHVPAGAIPKDGPSAGVAMFTALVSVLTGKTSQTDVAMTGEISLRGLVLPVGGIKEKAVAAARAGIKTVLLPARNKKDLEDIPDSARSKLNFVWLENVDEAIKAALGEKAVSRASRVRF